MIQSQKGPERMLMHQIYKRNWTLALIVCVMQVLVMTVPYLSSSDARNAVENSAPNELWKFLFFFGVVIVNVLWVIVLSMRSFSFVNDGGQAGLYFALPLTRVRSFMAINLAGLSLLLLPRLCSVLVNTLFSSTRALLGIGLWSMEWRLGLILIASWFFLQGMQVVMGNAWDVIFYSFLINFFWPAFVLIAAFSSMLFVPGLSVLPYLVKGVDGGLALVGTALSPALALFTVPFSYSLRTVIYWLIFTAVMAILSYYGYTRRPSERAGRKAAGLWPHAGVRLLVSLGGGLLAATLFGLIRSNMNNVGISPMTAFVIGFVSTACLAHFVMGYLAGRGEFDWKSESKSLIPTLIAMVMVIVTLQTGLFGMKPLISEASQFTELTLGSAQLDAINGERIKGVRIVNPEAVAALTAAHLEQWTPENPGLQFPRTPDSLVKFNSFSKARFVMSNGSGPWDVRLRFGNLKTEYNYSFIPGQRSELVQSLENDLAFRLYHLLVPRLGEMSTMTRVKLNDGRELEVNQYSDRHYKSGRMLNALLQDYNDLSLADREKLMTSTDEIEVFYFVNSVYKATASGEGPRALENLPSMKFPIGPECKRFMKLLAETGE